MVPSYDLPTVPGVASILGIVDARATDAHTIDACSTNAIPVILFGWNRPKEDVFTRLSNPILDRTDSQPIKVQGGSSTTAPKQEWRLKQGNEPAPTFVHQESASGSVVKIGQPMSKLGNHFG